MEVSNTFPFCIEWLSYDYVETLFRQKPLFTVLHVQPRSCSRAMKAVGVVEATCEEVFELVMSMDGTRYE